MGYASNEYGFVEHEFAEYGSNQHVPIQHVFNQHATNQHALNKHAPNQHELPPKQFQYFKLHQLSLLTPATPVDATTYTSPHANFTRFDTNRSPVVFQQLIY